MEDSIERQEPPKDRNFERELREAVREVPSEQVKEACVLMASDLRKAIRNKESGRLSKEEHMAEEAKIGTLRIALNRLGQPNDALPYLANKQAWEEISALKQGKTLIEEE